MRAVLAAAALIASIGALAFVLTAALALPAPEPHIEHAAGFPGGSDEYHWYCPDADGEGWHPRTLAMDVPEDAYRSAGPEGAARGPVPFVTAPASLVDPDDPYVRKVADHVLSETEGYPDDARKLAALRFVGGAIEYVPDADLYGCEDFWAAPAQTLYLHAGDCEDSSALLCSVLLAMGYDALLLHFPGHVAVGVESDAEAEGAWEHGGKRYVLCESTTDLRPLGSSGYAEGEPDFCGPSGAGAWESLLARMRATFWGLTGLRCFKRVIT